MERSRLLLHVKPVILLGPVSPVEQKHHGFYFSWRLRRFDAEGLFALSSAPKVFLMRKEHRRSHQALRRWHPLRSFQDSPPCSEMCFTASSRSRASSIWQALAPRTLGHPRRFSGSGCFQPFKTWALSQGMVLPPLNQTPMNATEPHASPDSGTPTDPLSRRLAKAGQRCKR
ncbi:MAG: hypothetical protein M2R46_02379 [Verrucomicrobia subdivision 3 bacterium]|nr:hypothetical protein [Limisphaerales bacterium]